MKTPIKWLTLGILLMLGVAAVTVGPTPSLNGPLGAPVASILNANVGGWAWTNTTGQIVSVAITYDLTPTASLQAAVDVRYTNSAGTTSNSFTSPVGTAAERVSLAPAFLEPNGVVQVTTNRGGGATVVFSLVSSTAIPVP